MNSKDILIKNLYLLIAIRENNTQEEKIKRVKKYLDEGADINHIDRNDNDNTYLHVAVLEDEPEIVKLLLERGADIDAKNANGKTAFNIAKQFRNLSIIEIFQNFSVSSEFLSQQESNKNFPEENQAENKPEIGVTQFLKQNKQKISNKKYRKQGLHGNIYQLKLLMLFLKRGLNAGFCFRLITEKKEARKFDDLIFEIIKDNGKEYRLLQAKHKEDELEKITFNELLTENDSDYSLVKYYFSYINSKNDPYFKKGIIKDVTVCTNINFDLNSQIRGALEEIKLKDTIQEIENTDYILDIVKETYKNGPVRYRFSENIVPLLKPLLNNYSLTVVAKRLAVCFLKNICIQCNKKDVFRPYHTVLAKEVINVNKKEFFVDFVNGSDTLSTEAKRFREIFKAELKKQPEVMSLKKVNSAIVASKVSFNLSTGFGKAKYKKNFIYNDQTPDLAKFLIKRILNSEPINTKGIFKSYHVALADSVIDVNNGMFRVEFIYGEGTSEDLEKFRNDLERESQLQGKLSLDEINQAVKDNRSKEKVGLNLSEGFGKGKNSNWPNDVISDEDINDFIDHLVFAVNQPNEEQLGKIIEKEISKEFNFSEKKHVYVELFENMLEWLKGNGNEFISSEDGKKFFVDIKTKLCELELTCVTLDCKLKMDEYNIKFNLDTTHNFKLYEFLSSKLPQKQVLNVITKQDTLSSIKIDQILNSMSEYKENNSYIFMKLKSILRLQEHVIPAFKGNCNLLVINFKISEREMERDISELSCSLCNAIYHNINKKVILITRENDSHAILLKNYFCIKNKYVEITDDCNSFDQLTSESQQEFLKDSKIIFQGKVLSLCSLIDKESEYLIEEELLSKIIRSKMIEVSKLPKDFFEIEPFYIKRKLITSDTDCNAKKGDYSGKLVSNEIYNDQFVQIFKIRNDRDVKWENPSYLFRSYKNLPRIQVEQNKLKTNIIVLADEPGSGKSTELSYIAKKMKEFDESLWVERINLNNHSKSISEAGFTNIHEVVDFLLDIVDLKTSFEKELFKHRIKKGKIIFLFDGFDEICPDYKKKVIQLLKILAFTKVDELWITTRPHMRKELELELNTPSYTLEPLSPEEQRKFLENYFNQCCKTGNEKSLGVVYTDILLDHVSNRFLVKDRDFTCIPLHLRMLAEAFQDNFKEYCDSNQKRLNLPQEFDLFYLYELFIRKKFDMYFKEKIKMDLTLPGIKEACTILLHCFILNHKLAAVVALFLVEDLIILLSKEEIKQTENFLGNVKEGKERTGIISYVIDNRPYFIHQTYAEYFAVELISDKLKSFPSSKNLWNFLINKIFLEDYQNIRNFFDHKLAKDINLANLISQTDTRNVVSELLLHNIFERVLCVAVNENLENVVIYLLKSVEGNKSSYFIKIVFYHTVLYLVNNDKKVALEILSECKNRVDNEIILKHNYSNGYALPSYLDIEEKGLRIFNILFKYIENSGKIALITTLLDICLPKVQETYKIPYASFIIPYYTKYSYYAIKSIYDLVESMDSTDRKSIINAKFYDGKSFLHLACDAVAKCRPYNLSLVECLLREGADVNAQDNFGLTPLHISVAARNGLRVVECLVNKTADLKTFDKYGKTPLHLAAQYGNLEVLKYLVNNGADVKAVDNQGETALHLAIENHLLTEAQNLIHEERDLTSTAEGRSRYCNALRDTLDMIKYLVEKGSDINSVDNLRRNALHHAFKIHRLGASQYQRDNEATLDYTDVDDKMPFNRVTRSNIIKILKYLLELETELEAVLDTSIGELCMDAVNHAFEVAQNSVDRKASSKCSNANETDPLDWEPQSSTLELVNCLVEEGADFKTANYQGATVLHLAVINRSLEVVQYLLDKGAELDVADKWGKTPLDWAAQSGNFEIFTYLLKKKSDLYSFHNIGDIFLIVKIYKSGLLTYFLNRGGNYNDECDKTLLQWAIQFG